MADASTVALANPDVEAVVDGSTCAICLDDIPELDTAMLKGCGHSYCIECILSWAEERERRKKEASCPQCKTRFSYVFCYRQLDGTLSEGLLEESLTLLLRAAWRSDKGKGLLDGGSTFQEDNSFDVDDYDLEDDDDDDELLARHHRVVIGNRRFGPNGFISNGRMLARPARPAPQPRANKSVAAGPSSSAASPSGPSRTQSGGSSGSGSTAASPSGSAAAAARNTIRAKREAKEAQKAEKEAQKAARRRDRLTQDAAASAASAAAAAAARVAAEVPEDSEEVAAC